ncbi:DUF6232 family protein [Streptomyces indicus]|uniref:Uncharacterized protein n=1 Tax=Streptomyces indicus TaxID=417292 RepID=A0A1G9GM86_9ACTN|nr:DUF6232 family protein [Streptomyces indicus]SDL01800.1 hypothetical protein SAMN05421806_11688 [Streptomyces indicus]
MRDRQIGEIVISRRVVQIGHEVYPLSNISRVRSLQLVWRGKYATWYPLRPLAITLFVIVSFAAAAQLAPPALPPDVRPDVESAARLLMPLVTGVGGVVAAGFLGLLIHRVFFRRTRYALVLETAGTQYTALSGTDGTEIHRIKHVIVDAIENPPTHPRSVQVYGDVVMGDKAGRDQFKMSGSGSR